MTIITRARAQEIKNYHSIITRGKAKQLNHQNTIVTESTAKSLKDSYTEEEIKSVLSLFDEKNDENIYENNIFKKEIDNSNNSISPFGYLVILFIMSLNVLEYIAFIEKLSG